MSADRESELEPRFGSAGEVREHRGSSVVLGSEGEGTEPDSEELRNLSEEISRRLAPRLEHTALLLYDRDPEHLQAQWHVIPEELAQGRSLFPGDGSTLRQVLRLCRLDQAGKAEVVASVPRGKGDWRGEGEEGFTLAGDGAEYHCELGLESDQGGWLLLVRSNRIRLADRNLALPSVGSDAGDTSPSLLDGIAGPHDFQEDLSVEAALAAVGEPLYPVFPNLESAESQIPRSAALLQETHGRAETLDRKSPQPGGTAVHQGVSLDRRSEAALPTDDHPDAMPPPLLPSSPHPRSAQAHLLDSFYDPRAALSSAVLPGFRMALLDMEVRAELIIQGRAAPGTTIELFGHPVAVGADGHFYLRRPIEDQFLLSLAIGRHLLPRQETVMSG